MTTGGVLLPTLHSGSFAFNPVMPLNHKSPFPTSRAFVVKFDDECHPAQGTWRGRVEHMTSGRQREFDSVDQLMCGLADMTPSPNNEGVDDPVPQPSQRGEHS